MTSDATATHPSVDAPLPPSALASAARPALTRYVPALALACALLAVWIVQHPAVGFDHDSKLYLIQALARLSPELFSQDVFLRFGSQDQYTLFSPLFAGGMRLFGVENAALVFSFVAQASFFTAVVVLARMLMPARLVWLGVLLVCAVPGFYGPGFIFKIVEEFVTPRLFAEALVVAGLAAYLQRRFVLAATFGLAGLLLHPLMTAGGVVIALLTNVTPPRVRAAAIAAGIVGAGGLFAWLATHGHQIRFDEPWLRLLQSGLWYLWPSNWDLGTWARTAVMASTLASGMFVLERSHARTLCTAGLIAALASIALNYFFGDLLELVLAVQSQPYRWLWVSTLISLLLLPLIANNLWSRGSLGHTAALLLIGAWLCRSESYGMGIAVLALLASVGATKSNVPLPANTQRLIRIGAIGVLALAAASHIAYLSLWVDSVEFTEAPRWLQNLRIASRTGTLPVVIFLLIYVAVDKLRSTGRRLGVVAGCLAMLAVLAPASAQEWTMRWYSRDFAAFADWRAQIPVGTEVLWFDAPVSTWMLLERPGYLSNLQETSGVFSRRAAMALKKRVDMLEPYISGEVGAAWRDKLLDGSDTQEDVERRAKIPLPLETLCNSARDLRFIVTRRNIIGKPVAEAPLAASTRYKDYRLYRCDVPHG
jgi:hypothetical protein